jgi:hypothetical protein
MELGHFDRHFNSRCSTVVGSQPRSGKSVTTSWTTTLANCHDKPTVDWGDMISKSIKKSLDKSDSGEKEDVQFYANAFKNKTGWQVYGARLEREQWVVKDIHGGCWSGDAYDDILKIFETSINLESIVWKLKDAHYISDYRKMNGLPINRFGYRLQDWIVELMKYNLKAESKEVFTEEKVNDMGLRIKKTDVLSIDEFKENDKAYDEVKINIDDEKLKKFEEDYGVYDFTIYLCKYVKICDEVIEFLPKALCIGSVHCVPYEFIENIECTYYLKTE